MKIGPFDTKELLEYTKGKVFTTLFFATVGILLIDMLHIKYWQYCLLYFPANLIIAYLIDKQILQKGKKLFEIFNTVISKIFRKKKFK